MTCQEGGRPGFKWGKTGHCYTYDPDDAASRSRALEKAKKQGRAIKSEAIACQACTNCGVCEL